METTAVRITLSNIHCANEADGPGNAEPYLWTVFFKVDGDTVTADSVGLHGTATVFGTVGDHGDLGTTDVGAGDDVPIPPSLGQFTGFVKPIPGEGGALNPGVIGYVATLLEQDSTPDHAIASGHATLNNAVQTELDKLLPTLKATDLIDQGGLDHILDALKKRISDQVEAAISNAQSTSEKLTHPNQDDKIGTDVKVLFAKDGLIGTDPLQLNAAPISIAKQFDNEGSWNITGTVAVVPSRHVYLKIVGRSPHGIPIVGSGPLPGASVQLLELDNPPPAGDDVAIPPVGETEHIAGGKDITDTRTYSPLPDQLLGIQTTDVSGVVAFQVIPNGRAGIYTHVRTVDDLHHGTSTTTSTHTVIPEALPDFGVTVVGHGGRRLATRQLVQLNAGSPDVGTAENPLVVLVDRDEPAAVV
jgi:hypothetical protein